MKLKASGSVTVDGKTIKEAILKGLAILGVSRSRVSVKILAEESQGLFGMRGARPARVRIALKGNVPRGT